MKGADPDTFTEGLAQPKRASYIRGMWMQKNVNPENGETDCLNSERRVIPKNAQHYVVFSFAVSEINHNNRLLPNISLGYWFSNNLLNTIVSTGNTLELLKRNQGNPTNYNCNSQKEIFAAIGALASENSIQMANMLTNYKIPQSLNGTLSFALHTNVVPGFDDFLDIISPSWLHDIVHFWEVAFKCYFLTVSQPHPDVRICTGQEKLRSLPGTVFETRMSGESYSIYNAAYAVAHALHALHSSTGKQTARGHRGQKKAGNIQPWQVSLSSFLATSHSSIGFQRQFLKASFTHCGIDD
ncbi:UNVERIFIED_CONTAM: hypothetical protein K2H54_035678 [Gekko kuhli]